MQITSAEEKRQEMMGTSEFNPSTFQKRLRTIVMCKPLVRQFKGDYWHNQQEKFFEMKARFLSATDPKKVEEFGKALVSIDQRLSEKQWIPQSSS